MVKQKMTARICILESLDQKQQTVSHYLTPRRLLCHFTVSLNSWPRTIYCDLFMYQWIFMACHKSMCLYCNVDYVNWIHLLWNDGGTCLVWYTLWHFIVYGSLWLASSFLEMGDILFSSFLGMGDVLFSNKSPPPKSSTSIKR